MYNCCFPFVCEDIIFERCTIDGLHTLLKDNSTKLAQSPKIESHLRAITVETPKQKETRMMDQEMRHSK